jgi:hypothetical protein
MPRHTGAGKLARGVTEQVNREVTSHSRLSKALLRLRDEHGLLNKEMAERLRVTEGYMSQVLRGRRDVRISMLDRIAEEFGVKSADDDNNDSGKGGGGPGKRRRVKVVDAAPAVLNL